MPKHSFARVAFVVAVSVFYGTAPAQSTCANPGAPRIGISVIPRADQKTDSRNSRAFAIGSRFGSEIAKAFAKRTFCVVEDLSLFDDPKNFPIMQGSLYVMISVAPSVTDAATAAISVEISAVQSVDALKSLHICTVPVLIEQGTDYSTEAEGVWLYYDFMTQKMSKHG